MWGVGSGLRGGLGRVSFDGGGREGRIMEGGFGKINGEVRECPIGGQITSTLD